MPTVHVEIFVYKFSWILWYVCLLSMKIIHNNSLAYLANLTMIVPTMPPWPQKLIPHKFFGNQKTRKINPQNLIRIQYMVDFHRPGHAKWVCNYWHTYCSICSMVWSLHGYSFFGTQQGQLSLLGDTPPWPFPLHSTPSHLLLLTCELSKVLKYQLAASAEDTIALSPVKSYSYRQLLLHIYVSSPGNCDGLNYIFLG